MTATKTYQSMGEFASAFPAQMAGQLSRFRDRLQSDATTHMETHSAREPVLTGALKASRSVIRGTGGAPSRIGWSAPYALVINLGRKRSKPYSRRLKGTAVTTTAGRRGQLLGAGGTKQFTRMLGSKKARGGMTRPAFRALRRDWPKVVEAAVKSTEGGF